MHNKSLLVVLTFEDRDYRTDSVEDMEALQTILDRFDQKERAKKALAVLFQPRVTDATTD